MPTISSVMSRRRFVVSLAYRRQVMSRWAQTIDGGSFRSARHGPCGACRMRLPAPSRISIPYRSSRRPPSRANFSLGCRRDSSGSRSSIMIRTPDPVDVIGCQVPVCLYRPESMPDAEITFLQADISIPIPAGELAFGFTKRSWRRTRPSAPELASLFGLTQQSRFAPVSYLMDKKFGRGEKAERVSAFSTKWESWNQQACRSPQFFRSRLHANLLISLL